MACPHCKDIGWKDVGRFVAVEERYCECSFGQALKQRIEEGRSGMKKEEKASLKSSAEKFSQNYRRDMLA